MVILSLSKKRTLDDKTLSTVLIEIEGIPENRLLVPVSFSDLTHLAFIFDDLLTLRSGELVWNVAVFASCICMVRNNPFILSKHFGRVGSGNTYKHISPTEVDSYRKAVCGKRNGNGPQEIAPYRFLASRVSGASDYRFQRTRRSGLD